jgi:tRNA1Val (adenine37-N6)-methyltransferase
MGTGSGVLALMAAQRNSDATITGVEIDKRSVEQARENILQSPWHKRVNVIESDLMFTGSWSEQSFDHILANPPYFITDQHSRTSPRQTARRGLGFTLMEVPQIALALLNEQGKVSTIMPAPQVFDFITEANTLGLFVHRRLNVRHKGQTEDTLVMLELGTTIKTPVIDILPLYEGNAPSREYQSLTGEFLSFRGPDDKP